MVEALGTESYRFVPAGSRTQLLGLDGIPAKMNMSLLVEGSRRSRTSRRGAFVTLMLPTILKAE
jgi:hypothetical protein